VYPQGTPIQLLLAYYGSGNNCNYFLFSSGPNGNTDTTLLPITSASALNCANISATTMSNLANAGVTILGVQYGGQYLDLSSSASFNRGDDQLLFIESVDPGTNKSCNQ
jgi:hypothetical protein